MNSTKFAYNHIVKNLTISLPKVVLDRLRILAAERKQSVNGFVEEVLREVASESPEDWTAKHSRLHKQIRGLKSKEPWTRAELHQERFS